MGITDVNAFSLDKCLLEQSFVPPDTGTFFFVAIKLMQEEQVVVPHGPLLLDDGTSRQSSRRCILNFFIPFTLEDFLVIEGSAGNLI
jgi:hypothetical protein